MPIFTNVPRKNWFSGIWFSEIWFRAILQPRTAILLSVLCLCRPALSQEISAALLQPAAVSPAAIQPATPLVAPIQPVTLTEANHRFWDRENSLLFATSAAFNAADFVVTKDNLHGGGQELNPVTRVFTGSTTGLAVNFVGETAGVVAISYFFHKTGHHKLERFTSVVNIGSSAGAVTFDLLHR
jgi:hypothetical protein